MNTTQQIRNGPRSKTPLAGQAGELQVLPGEPAEAFRYETANRIFFRLYQCANMLHKTGSRAVASEGLTTQQWAVLGALSRSQASAGMPMGELARYLMVSRQNLAGVVQRLVRDGHIQIQADGHDKRSRRVSLTASGKHVWQHNAQPKIRAYYESVLGEFSNRDCTHLLHYLLTMLEAMQTLDSAAEEESEGSPG